jgi:ketosteroid isomerase-like protein
MTRKNLILSLAIAGTALLTACASTGRSRQNTETGPVLPPLNSHAPTGSPTEQVMAAERAFARTMVDRDFKTFVTFVSSEAIFFSGNAVQHGAAEVAASWKSSFSGAHAPFTWAPDFVEVLPSGKLALSTGPVYVAGKVVGRFNSVWRLEGSNTWRVVFDKGEAVCTAAAAP